MKRNFSKRNLSFQKKLDAMRLTIAPIVHVTTGLPPPEYPRTMLQLFLLTEPQLDSMAQFYSQIHLSALTGLYPQTMDWNRPILDKPEEGEDATFTVTDVERLKIKMRMFARFIGMRGAETPTWELERQIEILAEKVRKEVEMEQGRDGAGWGKKFYEGPPRMW
jgi:hypothetical protein